MWARSVVLLVLSATIGIVLGQDGEKAKDETEKDLEKKREDLRWFPADKEQDCEKEPGLEQVIYAS